MSIDCFITTTSSRSNERDYFFYLTQIALHLQGFHVKIVEEKMLDRYFKCEELATSDIYILCDDDIIPATSTALRKLIRAMRINPLYSQMGLGWKMDMRDEENSSWIRNKEIDKDGTKIWEMDHVGGCMAIRKGSIKDLGLKAEFKSGYGDDRVMGKTARELGYKVGIVPHLYFYHLGAQFTTFKHG